MTVAETNGLERIEHIVVLMLENRSFDHMLGYLSLEGGREEIDGLRPGMANDLGGRSYPIHHLGPTYFPNERWDPEHTAAAVDRQINGGAMDGFPASYAETLAARGVDADPGVVMGYYNASDLPVFDHFAEQFCVCDRWHSSVAGATGRTGSTRSPGKIRGVAMTPRRHCLHQHSFVGLPGCRARIVALVFPRRRDAPPRRCQVPRRPSRHFAYVQKLKLVLRTPRPRSAVPQ